MSESESSRAAAGPHRLLTAVNVRRRHSMFPGRSSGLGHNTIMLVGSDHKQILKRRLETAGARVISVSDGATALDCARRLFLKATVLVSRGTLIEDTETVFNLRDVNRTMAIILLVDRVTGERKRLLRQLVEHPIEGTRVITRRQMQRELNGILAGAGVT